MKKIFTILMLLCTISVFAANATETYTGKLTVTINDKAPIAKDPQNVMVADGDIVTLTIPNFSISGTSGPDVIITASKGSNGVLTLKTIKYGFIPIAFAQFTNSTLINGECHINLSISAGDTVNVVFDGKK